MTVSEGSGGSRTRFVRGLTYPVEEGLILGTTKLPETVGLVAEEGSAVQSKDRVGL
jgi:hypothetical protein